MPSIESYTKKFEKRAKDQKVESYMQVFDVRYPSDDIKSCLKQSGAAICDIDGTVFQTSITQTIKNKPFGAIGGFFKSVIGGQAPQDALLKEGLKSTQVTLIEPFANVIREYANPLIWFMDTYGDEGLSQFYATKLKEVGQFEWYEITRELLSGKWGDTAISPKLISGIASAYKADKTFVLESFLLPALQADKTFSKGITKGLAIIENDRQNLRWMLGAALSLGIKCCGILIEGTTSYAV